MIKTKTLFDFIDQTIGRDLLAESARIDGNANGIQVRGSDEVEVVAIGVSANLDFLQEAVKDSAQVCLFHHGLHLASRYIPNARIDRALQNQLKYVLEHDLTIAGYHFALDHHPIIGNNAIIIDKLGAVRTDDTYFDRWGWVGEFPKAIEATELADRCAKLFEHDVFAVYGGSEMVKRIGVVSGGGKPQGAELLEIEDKHIDLHLTGEIVESGPSLAKDGGFNYFACGHYATEVFGIQALGNMIKDEFKNKLKVEFIDIANPL